MAKFSLLPRQSRFFALFEESAKNAAEVAQQLQQMLETWENAQENMKKIAELEHTGDRLAHEIIALVHRTFVTPLDREDIALLAHSLDDVVDFIEAAANALDLYKIEKPTGAAKELAEIIVQITRETYLAISELRRRIDLKKILQRSVEINRLENMADKVYREALAELFCDSIEIPYIIKWREIYEYMESATDRCEDVANVLEGVALKYA